KDPADRQRLYQQLNVFAQIAIPDSLWDAVGDALATLRAAGVVVPFPDTVLACVAIQYGIELFPTTFLPQRRSSADECIVICMGTNPKPRDGIAF
ncbi:MAG TPA: hypothetical protein VFE62_19265, partial [Gemmataceae bacterium]|nr:hypothetical protein [Gemmataceae bacterium]